MDKISITEKYVRKPLYVDAVQVTEENFETIARWCVGEISNIDESPVTEETKLEPIKQYIHVRVHNPKNPRQTKAYVGDWILYTERGYKVYTAKAFQANFDRVVPETKKGGTDEEIDSFGPEVREKLTSSR